MAAPTFVDAGASGVNGSSSTSAVISFSGATDLDIVGEATNDYAIVGLYKESTATVTAPSGWTLLGTADQDTGGFKYRAAVYGRRIDGTEGIATWSWSGSTWRYAECQVYRNAITSEAPVVVITFDEETAQNTAPSHPGITITRSNSGLVWLAFNFSDITNTTAPTGYTHRVPAGTSLARNILSYDDLSTVTGASGTVSATLGGDIEWPLTVLIELATEAAAGGITGSGGLTIGPPAIAATGVETFTGTSTVAITKPALASSGLETFTGSAALAIGAPAIAASGLETFSGSAALTIAVPSIAASGSEVFTGTSALTIAVPSIAGDGAAGDVIAGSGSIIIAAPSLAASGLETFTGAATVTIAVPSIASSGLETFTGAATVIIAKPAIAGDGAAGDVISGGATITIQKPSLASSGLLGFTGDGALLIGAPSIAANGLQALSGTATITIQAPGIDATGTALVNVTGTGTIVISVPSISGSEIAPGPGTVHGGAIRVGAMTGGPQLVGAVTGGRQLVGSVHGGTDQ